ncbi:MAG: copper amine oxidase N-terminal domain-containing protein [Thermoanaerobacteraceae bacterium]|nr:copper amine oxidase N-terminal domain-containing protein [Thermoanaerobacteraceae bacterium]
MTLRFKLKSLVFAEANFTAIFTIGKNEYSINGQPYPMDVAPYIKDDRTFLPLRYIAYADRFKNCIYILRQTSMNLLKNIDTFLY